MASGALGVDDAVPMVMGPTAVAFGLVSSIAEYVSEHLVGASGTAWKSPVKA